MDISKLRQKIYFLQQERKKLESKLMKIGNMTAGSLSYVYNVCGNPNCKCKKGKKHGPYPLLSLKIGDKKTSKFVKKEETRQIEKQVNEYKRFQKGLKRQSEVNQQIKKYFHEIRKNQIIK